jgi:hypothetical protein
MRNHTLNISPDVQVTSDKICLGKVATIYSKTGLLWEATYNPNGFGAISQYFKNQDAALDFLVGVHEKNKRAEALRELEQDILEYCRDNPGKTTAQIAEALGKTTAAVQAVLDALCPEHEGDGGYFYVEDEDAGYGRLGVVMDMRLCAA